MSPLLAVLKDLSSRRLIVCFVLIATTTAYNVAQAYVVLRPTLSTTNSYDDNPLLNNEDANALVFTRNEVRLASTYVRPTYEVGITPKFRFSHYTEDAALNSEEYFVSTFANKLFERHQVGAAFDYEREATFSTERDDSGLFNVNLFRTTLSGQSTWSYFISEKTTLLFNGYVSDVSFESDPGSRFVDYLSYGAGASVKYEFSESTAFWAIFNRSNFKTPQISSETESYSFQLGFDHQLTETTNASFRIGKNRSHLEFKQSQLLLLSLNPPVVGNVIVDEEENATGDIIQLTIEKEFSKASLRMNWDRRFSPSSQGSRQEIEEVGGFLRYRLTKVTDFVATVLYRQRTQEGTLITNRLLNDLDILHYDARLLYRLSPTLTAETGYRYREQTRTGRGGTTSNSHRLFVVLRYRPTEMRFW